MAKRKVFAANMSNFGFYPLHCLVRSLVQHSNLSGILATLQFVRRRWRPVAS